MRRTHFLSFIFTVIGTILCLWAIWNMYYKQSKIQSRGGVTTSQVQRTPVPQKIYSNKILPKEKEVSKKDLQKQLQIMQVRLDNIYTILIRACIQSEKPKSNYQNP